MQDPRDLGLDLGPLYTKSIVTLEDMTFYEVKLQDLSNFKVFPIGPSAYT
jgi:hypothetical protein